MKNDRLFEIPGYEGYYAITKSGEVWGLDRQVVGRGGSIWNYKKAKLKAGKNPDGYLCVRLCRDGRCKTKFVHRLMAEIFHACQQGQIVDHINQRKTDNRIDNLRVCNPTQNRMNSGADKRSKTGYRGVAYYKPTGKYSAAVTKNGKRHHCGYFFTAVRAAKARDDMAKKLHGEFAVLNLN